MTDDLDTPDATREDLDEDASGSAPLTLDDSLATPGDTPGKPPKSDEAYRVLARKYRPTNFKELIGQTALVRTLSNAIKSGRIAHAFILTGVRGVGKTTTARIIARALNCTGVDGGSGPTIDPCGVCENCISISNDRHVDVIEMDAASRTGIDDIRELIEGVRYRPVSARYKVYIIDEVHMLSRQAFNGLLKTLEEPPEHVIFIFATTEIRRLPVTVLSRCQRFDLRRVDMATLSDHFKSIAAQEGVGIEDEALTIIARAADGSVRDGLSLLDQAIALAGGAVTATQIRDMLGLADRNAVFDLFDHLMSGKIADALALFELMYRDGADPVIVLQDLLDVTYWLTRVKISPEIADAPGVPEMERTRGVTMAKALPMPVLTRNWQMLLKGLQETQHASAPMQAAEMTLIRIAYAADVPPPSDLVRRLQSNAANTQNPSNPPTPTSQQNAPAAQAPQQNSPAAQAPQGDQPPTAAPRIVTTVTKTTAPMSPPPRSTASKPAPPLSTPPAAAPPKQAHSNPEPTRAAPASPPPAHHSSQGLSIDEFQTPPDLDPGYDPAPESGAASDYDPLSAPDPVPAPNPVAEPTLVPMDEQDTASGEQSSSEQSYSHPVNFEAVVKLFEEHREGILTKHLRHDLHLVAFESGRIEFRPSELAPRDLASKLSQHLSTWTGMRWIVTVSSETGAPTLAHQEEIIIADRLLEAESHPMVAAVRSHFPGAIVKSVTIREPQSQSSDDASDSNAMHEIPKGGAQR